MYEQIMCVKSRLDCLKVLHQGCADWIQKHSFPCHYGSSPVLHELFFPSPDVRSDFLSFRFKNKDVSKNSKVPAWWQIWLGKGKKYPSDSQIHFLPHCYLLINLSVQPFSPYLCFHTLTALSLFSKSLHNQVRFVTGSAFITTVKSSFLWEKEMMI